MRKPCFIFTNVQRMLPLAVLVGGCPAGQDPETLEGADSVQAAQGTADTLLSLTSLVVAATPGYISPNQILGEGDPSGQPSPVSPDIWVERLQEGICERVGEQIENHFHVDKSYFGGGSPCSATQQLPTCYVHAACDGSQMVLTLDGGSGTCLSSDGKTEFLGTLVIDYGVEPQEDAGYALVVHMADDGVTANGEPVTFEAEAVVALNLLDEISAEAPPEPPVLTFTFDSMTWSRPVDETAVEYFSASDLEVAADLATSCVNIDGFAQFYKHKATGPNLYHLTFSDWTSCLVGCPTGSVSLYAEDENGVVQYGDTVALSFDGTHTATWSVGDTSGTEPIECSLLAPGEGDTSQPLVGIDILYGGWGCTGENGCLMIEESGMSNIFMDFTYEDAASDKNWSAVTTAAVDETWPTIINIEHAGVFLGGEYEAKDTYYDLLTSVADVGRGYVFTYAVMCEKYWDPNGAQ